MYASNDLGLSPRVSFNTSTLNLAEKRTAETRSKLSPIMNDPKKLDVQVRSIFRNRLLLIWPIWRKLWFCSHTYAWRRSKPTKIKVFLCRECKSLMVFCYQNCSDLLWEKIILVIEKNFWNCWYIKECWRFLISNKLEQLEFNYRDLETCRKS